MEGEKKEETQKENPKTKMKLTRRERESCEGETKWKIKFQTGSRVVSVEWSPCSGPEFQVIAIAV